MEKKSEFNSINSINNTYLATVFGDNQVGKSSFISALTNGGMLIL